MYQFNRMKSVLVLAMALFLVFGVLPATAAPKKEKAEIKSEKVKALPGFRVEDFPDMSDFDPGNPMIPHGDTIKIALVSSFSGPSAINGQIYFLPIQWAAHAINKKGGILVDGKRKLIEVIKADHMSSMANCKKVCERMALQEKVHFMIGSDGSHYQKIINDTAGKYNIIAVSVFANSDELMDAVNFNRNAFLTSL